MSVKRPSLAEAVKAMTEYPTADVDDDASLAEAVALTEDLHVPSSANADRNGRYGHCRGCGQWWPCPTWTQASYTSIEWLVLVSNAVMRRSGSIGPALPVGGRPPLPDVMLPECIPSKGPCSCFDDIQNGAA